jgi:ketosteroid isomerase-like protein
MDASEAVSTPEIDVIRAAYAALNRGDVAGFVESFDTDVVRTEPEEFRSGGPFRGLAAVTEHVAEGRATWAEGACEPRRFGVAGNRVLVWVDVRVRVQGETDWRVGRTVDGFAFRHGKVVAFHTFVDERLAREWADAGGVSTDEGAAGSCGNS